MYAWIWMRQKYCANVFICRSLQDTIAIKKRSARTRRIRPVSTRLSEHVLSLISTLVSSGFIIRSSIFIDVFHFSFLLISLCVFAPRFVRWFQLISSHLGRSALLTSFSLCIMGRFGCSAYAGSATASRDAGQAKTTPKAQTRNSFIWLGEKPTNQAMERLIE